MRYATALRHHVERSLRRDLGLGPLTANENGAYVCCVEGRNVVVAPEDDCATVRVWAPAAFELKRTAALLRELNDVNCHQRHVRVVWEDGLVVAVSERAVKSVEVGELGWLVRLVAECASRVSELVAAVYGGTISAAWSNQPDGPGRRQGS